MNEASPDQPLPSNSALASGLGLLSEENWAPYRPVIEEMQARRISFALGGGLAFSFYGPRVRNTKDVDFYVRREDKATVAALLAKFQFVDFYDQKPYDRAWIYRSIRDHYILDVIWQMANGRAGTDELWLSAGPEVDIYGLRVRFVPLEELIWSKLYVIQFDRCDWPDLLNLIYARAAEINWQRLLRRADADTPLLAALISVFAWMCPAKAAALPSWLWWQLGIAPPTAAGPEPCDPHRVRLLDTRDWFGPVA